MFFDDRSGWWFPDGETHLPKWLKGRNDRDASGRLLYQGDKFRAAVDHCNAFGVAVDVGAHIGLWSHMMADRFSRVIAFEPMATHRECFEQNVTEQWPYTVELLPYALGQEQSVAKMKTRTRGSSGDTNIVGPDCIPGGVEVEVRTLDLFDLECVDLLKIDVEGFELFVLQGGRQTIKRCKPVIVVEQKGKPGMSDRYGLGKTDAVDYLLDMGAQLRQEISGDYILSWDI